MIQTEAGLDKRKEVRLTGLFFWHQLVHYCSALMVHFVTGFDILVYRDSSKPHHETSGRPQNMVPQVTAVLVTY
jgi:hypothetical protein